MDFRGPCQLRGPTPGVILTFGGLFTSLSLVAGLWLDHKAQAREAMVVVVVYGLCRPSSSLDSVLFVTFLLLTSQLLDDSSHLCQVPLYTWGCGLPCSALDFEGTVLVPWPCKLKPYATVFLEG